MAHKARKVPKFDFGDVIMRRITVCPERGCWIYGKVEPFTDPVRTTYRAVRICGVTYTAHRASYAFFKGNPRNSELVIDHTCENKACVNPDHLVAATVRENTERAQGRREAAWARWYASDAAALYRKNRAEYSAVTYPK